MTHGLKIAEVVLLEREARIGAPRLFEKKRKGLKVDCK
jgi:hypothetical protein